MVRFERWHAASIFLNLASVCLHSSQHHPILPSYALTPFKKEAWPPQSHQTILPHRFFQELHRQWTDFLWRVSIPAQPSRPHLKICFSYFSNRSTDFVDRFFSVLNSFILVCRQKLVHIITNTRIYFNKCIFSGWIWLFGN